MRKTLTNCEMDRLCTVEMKQCASVHRFGIKRCSNGTVGVGDLHIKKGNLICQDLRVEHYFWENIVQEIDKPKKNLHHYQTK